MSDQMTPDLETRVAAWLAGRAPADVPEAFAERIAAIPRSTPGARPVRVTTRRRTGRGTRPVLLAAAAVALTLGLIAGGMFLGSTRRNAIVPQTSVFPSVAPAATATPTPTPEPTSVPDTALLPATIPDAVDHGTIDTPLGPARWVHIQGDSTSLPNPYQPIVVPDGSLAWFSPGGPGAACFNAPTSTACTDPPTPALSVSDDILAARAPRSLPVEAAQGDLRLIGETFWLVTSDPVTVWHSKDLADWTRADTSALRSPGPASIAWTMSLSPQVVVGDSPIGSVSYVASDPGALLGHPGETVGLGRDDAGGFIARQNRPRSQGGDVVLGAITIREIAGGIRFLDAAGIEVGRVDGVDRTFADSWAKNGEIRYDRLAAFDGDTWANIELPVTQLSGWPMVVDVGDSVLVLVTEPDTHVRTWRTTDGRTWTGGAPVVDTTGAPITSSGMTYRGQDDDLVFVAYGMDGTSGWTSPDGERWTASPDVSGGVVATRFDRGFLRTADQTEDGTWQASRDGITFQPVPALQEVITKTVPDGAGGSTEFAIGDTVFFVVEEGEGAQLRDIWMIEFAPPPTP